MFLSSSGSGNGKPGLAETIRSRNSHFVHLTHNDLDAVGSDAIHRMRYDTVLSIFCSVANFPLFLDIIGGIEGNNDLLSISDLGYQPGVERKVRKVRQAGWRIEWRDHHRWAEDDIAIVRGLCDLLTIDPSTCACGICARDLLPDDTKAQEVALVVCDYDLWKHQDPRSAVLGIVLQRRKNRDHVRDLLIQGVFTDPEIEGEYREIVSDMQTKMRKSIRKVRIMGTKFQIAFSPLYGYPSETAARMREELSTDIEVLVSRGGRFSIRSVPPISHLIAREFGGGGHPHAAGGNFHFSFWDRIRFLLFGSTHEFSRFVEIAESI
jgi:oligoribonuclease NrnB/cAMP/cGMP phosphodiesterase (DHH superfamily)